MKYIALWKGGTAIVKEMPDGTEIIPVFMDEDEARIFVEQEAQNYEHGEFVIEPVALTAGRGNKKRRVY